MSDHKPMFPNFDIKHIIFLIVILILVIAAAAAVVYSTKKYVALGHGYNEKVKELGDKDASIAGLQKQVDDQKAEIEKLKGEQAGEGAAQILLRQKNKELEELQAQHDAAQKELTSLKDYSRCDALLTEYKEEYNTAMDALFTKTKDVCGELYFGGATYDTRKQLKNMLDAEIKLDEYKAGVQAPVTN